MVFIVLVVLVYAHITSTQYKISRDLKEVSSKLVNIEEQILKLK